MTENVNDRVPPWLWVMLGAAFGAAITAGVMTPTIATPDYERGYHAGYGAGRDDGFAAMRQICEQEKR